MPTIRWFGGAAEAAGREAEAVDAGTTLGAALHQAVTDRPRLASVLPRCSLLLDGVHTTDETTVLTEGATLDVLPPFAGG